MTEKEIKVILEILRAKKEGIKLILSDNNLEIYTNDRQRKDRKTIGVPPNEDTETMIYLHKWNIRDNFKGEKCTWNRRK